VIEEIGGAGLDDGQVVDDPGRVRHQVGNPGAALPVASEGPSRAEQLGAVAGRHERKAFPGDERVGHGLTVEFVEARLVVEEVQLAGAARHEEIDHRLRPGRKVRGLRRGRIRGLGGSGGPGRLVEQGGERDIAEPDGAATEKVAAGQRMKVCGSVGREGIELAHERLRVSSRFSRTRPTVVQTSDSEAV
jgi:hypothetical protein